MNTKEGNTQVSRDSAMRAFEYQLDILKKELDTTNEIIARQDGMSQTTKNWTVVAWGGAVAFALRDTELRHFVGLTAILPLLFWFIDGTFRRLQARTVFRVQKIHNWLNSRKLALSFEKAELQGIEVFDPTSRQDKDLDEYRRATTLRRTLRYPEVRYFYAVPVLISLALQLAIAISGT